MSARPLIALRATPLLLPNAGLAHYIRSLALELRAAGENIALFTPFKWHADLTQRAGQSAAGVTVRRTMFRALPRPRQAARLFETALLALNARAREVALGADLRESCEATALPDGRRDGRRIIGAALDQVIAKWLALCWQNMRMTLVSHTNFLLSPILALLFCMPKYVAGTMTLGDVIQPAAAFVLVQSAFNWITDSYVSIAEWTSSANRVASLLVAIDQIERPK